MEEKIKNYVEKMQAFSKETYHQDELFEEYLALQKEMVETVFGAEEITAEDTATDETPSEKTEKRVMDVYNYLKQTNEELGGVATEELKRFKKNCAHFHSLICGFLVGRRGERLAFKSMQTLRPPHEILKNVELEADGHKAELDLVVFTKKAVFLLEVKNPRCDILIDENGNMLRKGEGRV